MHKTIVRRGKVWLKCTIREEDRVQITVQQAERLHNRGLIHPGEEYTLADGVDFMQIEAALEAPNARV